MKTKIAIAVGALMLAASPAALAVGKPEGTPSHGNGHAQEQGAANGPGVSYAPGEEGSPPGPKATLPEKAKAYGVYCRGESRKHEKGEKGTAFSRCVHNVVQLRRQERKEAREARKKEREEARKEREEARKEREEAREGEGA
jgi:hypothetical protein